MQHKTRTADGVLLTNTFKLELKLTRVLKPEEMAAAVGKPDADRISDDDLKKYMDGWGAELAASQDATAELIAVRIEQVVGEPGGPNPHTVTHNVRHAGTYNVGADGPL